MLLTYNKEQRPCGFLLMNDYLIHNKELASGIPSVLKDKQVQKDVYVESISIVESSSRAGSLSFTLYCSDEVPLYFIEGTTVYVYLGYDNELTKRGPFKIKDPPAGEKVSTGSRFTFTASRSGDLYSKVRHGTHSSGTHLDVVTKILEGSGFVPYFSEEAKAALKNERLSDTTVIAQVDKTDLALVTEILNRLGLRLAFDKDSLDPESNGCFIYAIDEKTISSAWEFEYYIKQANVRFLRIKADKRSPRANRRQTDADDLSPLAQCEAQLKALQEGIALPEGLDIEDIGDMLAESTDVEEQMSKIGDMYSNILDDVQEKDIDWSNPIQSIMNNVQGSITTDVSSQITEVMSTRKVQVPAMIVNSDGKFEMVMREVTMESLLDGADEAIANSSSVADATSPSARSASTVPKNTVELGLVFGHMGPRVGDKISISGAKYPFDGDYKVKKVSHTYNNAGFNTNIEAESFLRSIAAAASEVPDEQLMSMENTELMSIDTTERRPTNNHRVTINRDTASYEFE